MKKLTGIVIFSIFYLPLFSQLTGFFDDFEDGSVDTLWDGSVHTLWKADHPGTFGITEDGGYLNIAYTRSAGSGEWDNFNFTPPDSIDVSENPLITLKIRSDVANIFTIKPIYSNGNYGWLQKEIPADNAWHDYTFELVGANYTGGYLQKIYMYFDGGSSEEKSGLVNFDDFQIAGFTISVENLQALLIDSSKVDLTWKIDDFSNLDHFNLYRSQVMGFPMDEQNKIGETADTIFHDTALSNNTTYHYKVTALDIHGREHAPSQVSIRTYAPGAIPKVEVDTVNASEVGLYEKLEITLNLLDAAYDNPYNPDEIDVYAWFYSPDGDSVRMNGFYDNYQNRDEWKIRFTANRTGRWEYRIYASDLDGTGSSESHGFTAVESANKGWLHVSPDNPNYLMYDDSGSFYGIAVYYPWNVTENRLDDFASVNGNIFGYWDCTYDNSGNGGGIYLLESMESGVGRYDQRKAARIDEVLNWAEARAMKVMLAIWVHGYLRIDGIPWDNGLWYEENPYSRMVDVRDFYTDSLALAYQEKHHRYMIARWGYSRALGIWEIINEMHGTTGWVVNESAAKIWVENVNTYFKENDPFKRPTTASFGGIQGASHYTETDQLGDMPNVHFYEQHGWPTKYPEDLVRSGLANVVSEARKLKSKGDRPAFLGEAGYYHMLTDSNTTGYTWEFHNSFWGGLTNGLATTPFWWEFNQTEIFTPVRLNDYKILNDFVKDIDFAHLSFKSSELSGENMDGYFMGADTTGFGWMKTYVGTTIANAPITLSYAKLNNGTYQLQWFDTWTGEILETDTTVSVGGILPAEVTSEINNEDIAFKLYRLGDGSTATRLVLFLAKTDTLVPGQWPWSPKLDSTMYKVVCYATDDQNRLDTSFHGLINFTLEGDGELEAYAGHAVQGSIALAYIPTGPAGSTIIATAEALSSGSLIIEGVTSSTEDEIIGFPAGFELKENYPNPFHTSTTIAYGIPETAHVRLAIYNLQGALLESLVDGQKTAGQHSVVWNAEKYNAGIYFYKLTIDGFSKVRKCILLK
jgi:hypothetical protein